MWNVCWMIASDDICGSPAWTHLSLGCDARGYSSVSFHLIKTSNFHSFKYGETIMLLLIQHHLFQPLTSYHNTFWLPTTLSNQFWLSKERPELCWFYCWFSKCFFLRFELGRSKPLMSAENFSSGLKVIKIDFSGKFLEAGRNFCSLSH